MAPSQTNVPVQEDDTPETLAERVFAQECEVYPEAVRLFAEGRLRIEGRRVRVLPAGGGRPSFDPELDQLTSREREVLRLLGQMREWPVILVTAAATASLIRQAQQARAYSVIPKPVNKSVVIYTVVRALLRAYGGPPAGERP